MKTFLIFTFSLLCSFVCCTTFYVDLLHLDNPGANQYRTITGAYNAASNGDVVIISPGDYFESLTITKSLILMGSTQSSARIINTNMNGFTITGSNVTIKNLYFKSTGSNGLYITGSLPVIMNCIFESCTYGIYLRSNTTANINNCIFRNCTDGFHMWGTIYGTLSNCIFHGTSTGVFNDDGPSYMNFYNSIFINNTNCFLRDSSFASWHGAIEFNATDNVYITGSSTTNIIETDPLLANISGEPYYNYFPLSNSPCVDSGNPEVIYNDLDGTRNDIGIFGGPNQWGAGMPVVLGIELSPNTVQQGGTFNIESTGQTK